MQKAKAGERPIGIFDSGIGGLTVFNEIRKKLPKENLIYFGDTARVPYGNKSRETIIRFAGEITNFLKVLNVKMIVVACNTVSSIALDELKRISGLPVIGVIEPAIELALKISENKKVGVIGTIATISSHSYKKVLKKSDKRFKIIEKACPLFVPLVEEGWWDKYPSKLIVKEYLKGLKKSDIDVLILGCTHYPFLRKLIEEELKGVKIVDSAKAVANKVYEYLISHNQFKENGLGYSKFIVSDSPEKFQKLAQKLLKLKIKKVYIKSF